jgi:hypothetical protein
MKPPEKRRIVITDMSGWLWKKSAYEGPALTISGSSGESTLTSGGLGTGSILRRESQK